MSKLRLIAKVIKERFPNLTVDETIDIAEKILMTIEGHVELGDKKIPSGA